MMLLSPVLVSSICCNERGGHEEKGYVASLPVGLPFSRCLVLLSRPLFCSLVIDLGSAGEQNAGFFRRLGFVLFFSSTPLARF